MIFFIIREPSIRYGLYTFAPATDTLPVPAVKSIKKQNLVEIRSMANPPPPVKMTLEAICLLLGENAPDWKAIRGVIIRDNFISIIINYNAEAISYVLNR